MRLAGITGAAAGERDYQCVFGGVNESPSAADGEITAMKNMTGDLYPLLAPRAARRRIRTLTAPHGLAGGDRLCWVDGTDFYWDGAVKGQVEDTDKRFYFLNRWVVIWPDKKFYNTATEEFGSLEASASVDGTVKKAVFCSSAAPGGISSEANCLRLDSTTVQGLFREGDGVTISGCTRHPENNLTLVVREVKGTALYFYDNSFTLDRMRAHTVDAEGMTAGCWNVDGGDFSYNVTIPEALTEGDRLEYLGGTDMKLVRGGTEQTLQMDYGAFGDQGWIEFEEDEQQDYAETCAVTVSRNVPELDYLCECDNRLWGVKDSTVCCSALGDPRVWYNFDGTATGCWSVEVGSAGPFTGACAYGGYPLLFKENHIYRVYGTRPANFQLMDTETLGCEAGSDRSFAVAGQTLYYKSRAGLAAYGGGVPSLIDSPLGGVRRQNASAGTDGRKYYVSLEDADGQTGLYVYDTVLGLWHREDDTPVMDFAWCGGELYMLTADGDLWMTGRIRSAGGTEEAPFESMAEFADFYAGSVRRKILSRLYFRVETEGLLRLLVSYDGGPWQECGCVYGQRKGLQTLHLIPRRCDSLRVRLEGEGPWRLWALSREYTPGTTRG